MLARRSAVAGAAVLAVALLLGGCGGSDDSSGSSSGGGGASATTTAASDKVSLTVKGIAWDKTQLNLPANKQVTVTVDNQDKVEHNFTFQDAKASKDAEGGESAEVSFTTPAAGTYDFFCKYHPSKMKGTVTVS